MQRTFHIITFGCQMNVTDSQWLSRSLIRRGFVESSLKDAAVTIINTCSVREKPEQKVYSAIGRAKATMKTTQPCVVVAGCVAQQLGTQLFDRFDSVRMVVGGDAMSNAPMAIERLVAEPALRIDLTRFADDYRERDPELLHTGFDDPVAYVNIMQGCNNFCAYCIVPYTRGPQKSRKPQAILDECRSLLDLGVKELVLLGQNVNSYGLDDGQEMVFGKNPFARLLQDIARLDGLERLRFVTPHPKDFSEDVISLFAELPVLCPRLHLPLQAGDDNVLAAMGRKYSGRQFVDLVEKLRRARPDLALSTDLIVGFPGETEEAFLNTLDLVREVDFMAAFSFCYSDRPGTRSAMLPNKLSVEVKAERLERLQKQLDKQAETWLRTRVGRVCHILLDGHSRKKTEPSLKTESWKGKDPWGNTVNVSLPVGYGQRGLLVPVQIAAAKRHSLTGILHTQ